MTFFQGGTNVANFFANCNLSFPFLCWHFSENICILTSITTFLLAMLQTNFSNSYIVSSHNSSLSARSIIAVCKASIFFKILRGLTPFLYHWKKEYNHSQWMHGMPTRNFSPNFVYNWLFKTLFPYFQSHLNIFDIQQPKAMIKQSVSSVHMTTFFGALQFFKCQNILLSVSSWVLCRCFTSCPMTPLTTTKQ